MVSKVYVDLISSATALFNSPNAGVLLRTIAPVIEKMVALRPRYFDDNDGSI